MLQLLPFGPGNRRSGTETEPLQGETGRQGVSNKMLKSKKKMLKPQYSSYHGKVHIPLIKKLRVSLGQGIIMNSGCPNHVVVNVPHEVKEDVHGNHE